MGENTIEIWKQSDLNAYMLGCMRHLIKLYQKEHDKTVDTFLGATTNDEKAEAKQASGYLEVLIYLAHKAEKGIQMGKTFTNSLWGIDNSAPITHSWCIVYQPNYGPALQGFGVKLGKDEPAFLMKPDGSFSGFAFYGIKDARTEVSQLINMAEPEQRHWFYLYNVITGEEERIYYGESLFTFQ